MSATDSFWTPESLRTASGGGRWLHRPLDAPAAAPALTGLSTDSRALRRGQVFLALRGDQFDGHAFVGDALTRGAAMLIVESMPAGLQALSPTVFVLQVDDTLKALARLASAYRRSLKSTRFIAITGSSGKTTTKQMLHAVLAERFRVSASPKSFNNNIGVPLTLLGAESRDQYVICEVGTNHPGEIAELASIVEPDLAIITSIGRVHLEGLGSIEGVAAEKAALLGSLAHGGWAAVNIDELAILPYVEQMERGVTFGFSTDADLRITDCAVDEAGTAFTLNDRSRWRLPLYGMHHASNATAVIGVGRRCGLSDDVIRAGLLKVAPPEMRFVRESIKGVVLYDDSYNANPESMAASIATFRQLSTTASRRIAILGDMLELGAHSAAAHRELAERIGSADADAPAPIDIVILIGAEMRHTAEVLEEQGHPEHVEHFPTLDDGIVAAISDAVRPGDHVLLKGSRGMRLERIVRALRGRLNNPSTVRAANGVSNPA